MAIETISSDASASAAPPSAGLLLKDAPVDALALTMRFLSYAEAMRAGSSCSDLREAYYKNSLIHVTTDVVGGKSVAIDLDIGSAKQVVLLSVIRSGLFGRAELSSIIESHATDRVVREHFDDWSWAWEALAKTQWPNCDKIFPRHAKSSLYSHLYDEKGGRDGFQSLAAAGEPREAVERGIMFFHDIKDGEDPMHILVALQRLHLTFEMDWGRWGHLLASAVAASGIVNRISRLLPSDDNEDDQNSESLGVGIGEAACRIFDHLCVNGCPAVISFVVDEGCLSLLLRALGSYSISDHERNLCACCLQTISATSVEMSNAVIEASLFDALGGLILASFNAIWDKRAVGWDEGEERVLVSSTKCLVTVLTGIRCDKKIHPLLFKCLSTNIVPTLNVILTTSIFLKMPILVNTVVSLDHVASMAAKAERVTGLDDDPMQIILEITQTESLGFLIDSFVSIVDVSCTRHAMNLMNTLAHNGYAKSLLDAKFLQFICDRIILQDKSRYDSETLASLISVLASNSNDSTSDEPWKIYGELIWPGCTEIFVKVPLRQLLAGDTWLYDLATDFDMIPSRAWLEQFACRLKTKNRKQAKILKSLSELPRLFLASRGDREVSALAKGIVASGGLSQMFRLLRQTDSAEVRENIVSNTFSIVISSRLDGSFVFQDDHLRKIMQKLRCNPMSHPNQKDITIWWVACVGIIAQHNKTFRDSIFQLETMNYLLGLIRSEYRPLSAPNSVIPLALEFSTPGQSLGSWTLNEIFKIVRSICTPGLTCKEKVSIVKKCMSTVYSFTDSSNEFFEKVLSAIAGLPRAVCVDVIMECLPHSNSTSRLVRFLKEYSKSTSLYCFAAKLLVFTIRHFPNQIGVAIDAGLPSLDFGALLNRSQVGIREDISCVLIGAAFLLINSFESQQRDALLSQRERLIELLSADESDLRYASAGALAQLSYGLVQRHRYGVLIQGQEYDRRESKAIINTLIEEGVVSSMCDSLGQCDKPKYPAGCGFTSSHFLAGIHGVLEAGSFEKNENITSDFIKAVAPSAPKISAFQQSTNAMCQFWSKRIMSEFFPEENSP